MTDPVVVSIPQKPVRNTSPTPLDGISSPIFEGLDDMLSGLDNLTLRQNREGSHLPEVSEKPEYLQIVERASERYAHLRELSTQLTKFRVAMSLTQSFGRNMNSFLKGQ